MSTKHVEPKLPLTWKYFNVIAPVLRHLIQSRYGYELAKRAYDGARPIYRDLIDRSPHIGAGNPMEKNIYEACVFFSMYRASEGDITPDMMRQVVHDLFSLPFMKAAGAFTDLRNPNDMVKLNARLHENAHWAEDRPEIRDATWDFNFGDSRGCTVASYYFTHCPLNDLCRQEGLMDILPVMCEIDYITPTLMHGKLTREHTLAQDGPYCDYLIEGE